MGMGMGVGIGKAKKEERGGRMSKINLGLMLEEWEIIIKSLEIYFISSIRISARIQCPMGT